MEKAEQRINSKEFTVKSSDLNEETFQRIFTEFGLCVIENAFSDSFCNENISEIVDFFEGLQTGVSRNDAHSFSGNKVPYETEDQPGMYQCLISNLPAVWRIRTSPIVRRCFSILYRHSNEFIVSSDGFTLTPNRAYSQPKDWPHVDQTSDGTFRCVQGQAVLTETTAAFVCSPKSHHIHSELLDMYRARSPVDFLELETDRELSQRMADRVREIGGAWQMPVVASKGSLIFWTSSLIHSARPSFVREEADAADPWRGWRCAVYVCYRPLRDFSAEEIIARAECLLLNRTTNHWGTQIIKKRPVSLWKSPKHPVIETLTEHPVQAYIYTKKPSLDDPKIRELSGIAFCRKNERIRRMVEIYSDDKMTTEEFVNKMSLFVI